MDKNDYFDAIDKIEHLENSGFQPNKLDSMFYLQEDFQKIVGNEDKILKNKIDSAFVVETTVSLIDELMEALRETDWKSWKSNQQVDIEKFREEIIDAWHFLINLSMAAGMSEEEVFERFLKKNKLNRERQWNRAEK